MTKPLLSLSHHMATTTQSFRRDPLLKRSAPAGRIPGLGYIVTAVIFLTAVALFVK